MIYPHFHIHACWRYKDEPWPCVSCIINTHIVSLQCVNTESFLKFSIKLSKFCRSMYILIQKSKHTHRSSLSNITNVVPSLQCISWFKKSKHTHRSSFANITNVVPPSNVYLDSKRVSILIEAVYANITNAVPSLQCISWFKESKHTHRSSFAIITNAVPSLQCISWFKESKHTHRSSYSQHYQCCTFPSMYILIQRE